MVVEAISEGADVNQVFPNGKSLLHLASEMGDRQICNALVDAGADPNAVRGTRHYSLLHTAVASSNFGMISVLLELNATPSVRTSNGLTPLHFAARTGQVYAAHKLLDHRADINSVDDRGRSPLYLAAERNDMEMVRMLIKHGADVNIADQLNRTPYSVAKSNEFKDIQSELIENGAITKIPQRRRSELKTCYSSESGPSRS